MKKIIFLIGSFVFIFFLISCSPGKAVDETDSSKDSFSDSDEESNSDEQIDNGQESVERTQADKGKSPSPNTFVIPELEITGDDHPIPGDHHPIPSQEPETKYVCKKEGQLASYSIYKPGITNNSHICELDTSSTLSPADWRAFNQADYCDNKLSEIIAEKQAQGFVCSQEN